MPFSYGKTAESGKRINPETGKFFWRALVALAAVAVVAAAYCHFAELGFDYEWRWNRAWRYLGHFGKDGFIPGPLLKGLAMTCGITVLAALLSFCLGLLAAVCRLSPWPFCCFLAKAYTGLWRGTPLLLQLFFAYFIVAPLFGMGPFWTAVFALAAFEGAYLAEIFRAGLLSVAPTQWEASLSLGFTHFQTLFLVVFPQAWANVLPPLTSQAIAILKDSSLVSAIAVADLTMRSQAIVAETFMAFEVWFLAGALYLVCALFISLMGAWAEYRSKWNRIKP